MKILFVYSGNGQLKSSIVLNQASSLEKLDIDIGYFPIKERGLKGYIHNIFLLKRYLNKNHYSIIHAHYGLCGIVALASSKKEKIVVSFMGDDLLGSTMSDGKISFKSKILSKINTILAKRFYDFSIVKSEEMLNKLNVNSNSCVCPNGVDLDIFRPIVKEEAYLKSLLPKGKINIIFVSDPSRHEKNFQLARSAVDFINDKSICLHVILNKSAEELKYFYSAADILIMTSLHEGSPNVIKEAMACNCPIVSTNVGDVKRITGDTAGCFITTFDLADVVTKIKSAIKFVQTNGRSNGRDRIIEMGLDSKEVARRIVEIYNRVLI